MVIESQISMIFLIEYQIRDPPSSPLYMLCYYCRLSQDKQSKIYLPEPPFPHAEVWWCSLPTISGQSDGNYRFWPIPHIIKISHSLSLWLWEHCHWNLPLVRYSGLFAWISLTALSRDLFYYRLKYAIPILKGVWANWKLICAKFDVVWLYHYQTDQAICKAHVTLLTYHHIQASCSCAKNNNLILDEKCFWYFGILHYLS